MASKIKVVVLSFLSFGKGKSGYSYLAQNLEHQYVVKLMHNESCDYYSFGDANKVELEVSAYRALSNLGIKIPKLPEIGLDMIE